MMIHLKIKWDRQTMIMPFEDTMLLSEVHALITQRIGHNRIRVYWYEYLE